MYILRYYFQMSIAPPIQSILLNFLEIISFFLYKTLM
nr:MAG TPA: hypothetical protein [Caudoviricetes sp.]